MSNVTIQVTSNLVIEGSTLWYKDNTKLFKLLNHLGAGLDDVYANISHRENGLIKLWKPYGLSANVVIKRAN